MFGSYFKLSRTRSMWKLHSSCTDQNSSRFHGHMSRNLTLLNLIQSDSRFNPSQMVPNMCKLIYQYIDPLLELGFQMFLGAVHYLQIPQEYGILSYPFQFHWVPDVPVLSPSGCMFAEERCCRGFAISVRAGTSNGPRCQAVNFRCPNCPKPRREKMRPQEKKRNTDVQM